MAFIKNGEDYKSFYLKTSTWKAIIISRGWTRFGGVSRFAEAIGITRQYASEIVHQRCGCSSNVMRRIISLLGIKRGEHWCHLFDMTPDIDIDPNHPMFNMEKYNGVMPYSKYSSSAELRKKDYKVEEM